MYRTAVSAALALSVIVWAVDARADAGQFQLELLSGYRTKRSVDFLVGATYGLSDFSMVRARGGLRVGDGRTLGRAELSAGYVFDVLTWVPELSLGASVSTGPDTTAVSGLALFMIRRYFSLNRYWAIEVGGEVGQHRQGLLLRLAIGI